MDLQIFAFVIILNKLFLKFFIKDNQIFIKIHNYAFQINHCLYKLIFLPFKFLTKQITIKFIIYNCFGNNKI